jgi:hypothetical protein
VIEFLLILIALILGGVWILVRRRAGTLDDFVELKWLFPRRRRKLSFDDVMRIRRADAPRGRCIFAGRIKPWNHKLCTCEGYRYEETVMNVAYCYCGCRFENHRYRYPGPNYT